MSNAPNQTSAMAAPRSDVLSEELLAGKDESIRAEILALHDRFDVEFITVGLAPTLGAPLKWIYDHGASSERLRRITLAPGHGVGGIVLKSGRPMLFTDLDTQLDPREYSSFPIVFAEDLRSFCALPLRTEKRVAGVLLLGYRTTNPTHEEHYQAIMKQLGAGFAGFEVVTEHFCTLEQIRTSNLEESLGDSLQSTLQASIITAQEEERRRLSRELHDGVVQELLAISLKTGSIKHHLPEQDKPLAEEIIQSLNQAMNELRDISVDLRPSTLDDLGLKSALVSQGKLYEKRFGPKVLIDGSLGSERSSKSVETQIYRILQEAILNSCKYSEADYVMVSLDLQDEQLSATVYDEGVGFDTSKPVVKGTGCGLKGMEERAQLIGAALEIESEAGHTSIRLNAPFKIIRPGSDS